ncbi:acyltransferase [Klebsiella aerogenes]|uniref:UDP-3-O-(3-hydroxymyristoyl)-glucosamine N-acyltransferase n=1 Tax=Klebsiella aerogenes (strain ATCC 13048 / DSM 30053 / CCUG 1429 / JCM 1235 / KCTC 2190 / NBRC 13534 / NCIMB 10102 / NCTC 10006 / CDC 819-56) TaxID=1028307 RepID=A0A0H3FUX6_KLEAK|nr:acyltransferase [Klebsiella aerogenes]AEG96594.1 UDP-3-O-(3-hydroxymyristoyl)-glucosamine N-acyltransferase [Klebsiella aerogenes KCTC 2190]ATX85813.1 N-acetyltransferase [Klebsiella aerogenes]ELA1896101.1 N-acetyltransferase [Klebsiella aerogenes]KLF42815.1 UDP-3-O-(3-hydroxymyristoyl) glucosamine N-acyltransferase [Klebsiella aerogenes]KLW04841.1 UDP-3-O-(3-hydroxymyristoyl)-glucosamine N-acyltransferase [Klebsiella aerogenes]
MSNEPNIPPFTLRDTGVRNVICGENVVIYQPANLYDCQLDDNVFIGPFVEIQGHTRIGADSKIQSHSFICEYVTIGQRCFIGHGVMFANDMFRDGKPNADRDSWGRIEIGNDVSIGSGATILAVSICDGVVIGAGSVVTKSITEKGVWAGNPARLLRRL